MATLHNFHQELASNTIGSGGLAAGDVVLVYDTSAGVPKLAQIQDITGAGRIITGVVTTGTLTTVAQTTATYVITSSNITIGDLVVVSLDNGTNTAGGAVVSTVTPGAGIATVKIFNSATTATQPFTGTFRVNYTVFKPS